MALRRTEDLHPSAAGLQDVPLHDVLGRLHAAQIAAAQAVVPAFPALETAARAAAQALRDGRRMAYVGAGSSGLMALAVVLLLVLVVPLTLSGYATFHDWGDFLGGDWVEDVHEFVGETFLMVVLAHLALMAGLSVLRQKNIAQPMLTGRVDGAGPDLAKRNHGWLAVLLLVAVLAYGAWEWQQSPNGLVTAEAISGAWSGDHHGPEDDDD